MPEIEDFQYKLNKDKALLQCSDMFGKEYEIPIWGEPVHKISTSEEFFKVGDKWEDSPLEEEEDGIVKVYLMPTSYVVTSVAVDGDFATVELERFSKIKHERKKKTSPDSSYCELLKSTDLKKETIIKLLDEMMHNLFKPEQLKEILADPQPQFIMDDGWMYLKAGNKAFRV